jgi:hypothetical protein
MNFAKLILRLLGFAIIVCILVAVLGGWGEEPLTPEQRQVNSNLMVAKYGDFIRTQYKVFFVRRNVRGANKAALTVAGCPGTSDLMFSDDLARWPFAHRIPQGEGGYADALYDWVHQNPEFCK